MSLFRCVTLGSVYQALHGANNWASSFAKALVDVGYPFLLILGTMKVPYWRLHFSVINYPGAESSEDPQITENNCN
jgi:hypothetical protein